MLDYYPVETADKIVVSYVDDRPVLNIAVQCPDCEKWFDPQDIRDKEHGWRDHIDAESDIEDYRCICPCCGILFKLGKAPKESTPGNQFPKVTRKITRWEEE